MIQTLFGIFLIAHGLVHSGLAAAPIPNDPASKPGAFFTEASRSKWLAGLGLGSSGIRIAGFVLVALATFGFLVAGLGFLGVNGLVLIWPALAVISAAISLLLLILFWHPWLVLGILINIGILAALFWPQ